MSGAALFKRSTSGAMRSSFQDERITPLRCEPVLRTVCHLIGKYGDGLTYHLDEAIPGSPAELVRVITLELGRIGATDQIFQSVEDLARLGYLTVTAQGSVTLLLGQAAGRGSSTSSAAGAAPDDTRAVNAQWNGHTGGVGSKARSPEERKQERLRQAEALIGAHDPDLETLVDWKRRALVEFAKQPKPGRAHRPVPGQAAMVMGVPSSRPAGQPLTTSELSMARRASFKVASVDGMSVSDMAVGSPLGSVLGSELGSNRTQPGIVVGSQLGLNLGSHAPAQLASLEESSIDELKLASSSGVLGGDSANPEPMANPQAEPSSEAEPVASMVELPSSKDAEEAFEVQCDSLARQISVLTGIQGDGSRDGPDHVGSWLIQLGMSPALCMEIVQRKVERNDAANKVRVRQGKDSLPIRSFGYFDRAMEEGAAKARRDPPVSTLASPPAPTRALDPAPRPSSSFTRPVAEPPRPLPVELRDKSFTPADEIRLHVVLDAERTGDVAAVRLALERLKASRPGLHRHLLDHRPHWHELYVLVRRSA